MQFQELEELGYQEFAVAFYKEYTGTRIIEYLHAIIVPGTEYLLSSHGT